MLLDSGLMIKDAWFLLLRQFTLSKKCLLFWRFSSLNRFKWLVPSDIAGSIRTPHRSFRNIITQGLDFIQKGLKLVTFSKICTVGNCHPQNSPLRFKRSDKRGLPFQCPLEILLNQPRFTMVNISVCAYCGSTCMVTRYYDIIFYICSGGYPFSVARSTPRSHTIWTTSNPLLTSWLGVRSSTSSNWTPMPYRRTQGSLDHFSKTKWFWII